MSFSSGHHDGPTDWLRRNLSYLPSQYCPREEDLRPFANLLASYLETSFELLEAPRRRLESNCGCLCSLCATMVDLSRLVTRKVGRHDKADARQLMRAHLVRLAESEGLSLDGERALALAASFPVREPLAMTTWGYELLRRMDGYFSGPAVLALWRMFAWTPTGAPRKGVAVTADGILEAEARLVAILRETPAPAG